MAVHFSARHITLKERPSGSEKRGGDVAKGASACSVLGKGRNMLLNWERDEEVIANARNQARTRALHTLVGATVGTLGASAPSD